MANIMWELRTQRNSKRAGAHMHENAGKRIREEKRKGEKGEGDERRKAMYLSLAQRGESRPRNRAEGM